MHSECHLLLSSSFSIKPQVGQHALTYMHTPTHKNTLTWHPNKRLLRMLATLIMRHGRPRGWTPRHAGKTSLFHRAFLAAPPDWRKTHWTNPDNLLERRKVNLIMSCFLPDKWPHQYICHIYANDYGIESVYIYTLYMYICIYMYIYYIYIYISIYIYIYKTKSLRPVLT